jgi:hypothetical protein
MQKPPSFTTFREDLNDEFSQPSHVWFLGAVTVLCFQIVLLNFLLAGV